MITLYWTIGILFFAIPVTFILIVALMILTDGATLEEQLDAADWLNDVDDQAKS